ncbi:hypothetical protein Taro_030302 [Colocasia esculenta]|uniref:Uncharacterized protein n=1 Tax=Colocasia esculenta TaxID=4460 RepID=A0A843VG11_COLES|nr:hypothetical protein [Colocasia esculenta]
MELQGKKAVTHDFLSLYKDSASQDSKPAPQEFLLETHDFLQPLEKGGGGGAKGPGDAPPSRVDIKLSAAPEAATGKLPDPAQPVRPGGFCTYSVSHVTCFNAPARPVGLRPDWFTCGLPSPGAASGADRKAEYSKLSRAVPGAEIPPWGSATSGAGRGDAHVAGAFALWEESALPRDSILAGRGKRN